MNKRGGDDYGYGGGKRARGSGIRMRMMVPSKMAGSLIGKGGQNIKQLREEYSCNVRIPDCPGPERIMEITAEDWENVFSCLEAAVPYLFECPNGVDDGQEKELRFLIHQSVVGGVIGKGGEKIKAIRAASGVNIKVYQNSAPQSTDRCVQANGTLDKIVLAAREVYEVVQNTEIKGNDEVYDPINFDAFFATEYGGFGGGSDQKMASRGGRGGGGMRGGPMGGGMRGGPGGFGGSGFGRPMGFEDGPPRGGGFGRGGFGRGGGGMGGGMRGGMGGGMGRGFSDDFRGGGGADLQFSSSDQSESTQVTIPNEMAGAIIGPGGQRIRKIRNDSKAGITIAEPESGSNERVITLTGDPTAIQTAQFLLQQSVREFGSSF